MFSVIRFRINTHDEHLKRQAFLGLENGRSLFVCLCVQKGRFVRSGHRANAQSRPAFFPKLLYKGRARIEQAMGKLKRFKRIALRCEKTAENYGSLVAFACAIILVKSVHTA